MGVLEQLETEQGDAPTDAQPDDSAPVDGAADPFALNYDFSDWEVDTESTDHALSLLIAVTNLL